MQGIIGKVWTASHTLHRTTIQQRFANPCGLIVGFLLSVSPQAVPARCTPAFWLSLVRSCHGGTSLGSHSALQPIIQLSKNMSFH